MPKFQLIFFGLAFLFGSTFGCPCEDPPDPWDAFEESDAIFAGKLITTTTGKIEMYTFLVTKIFKGSHETTQTVSSIKSEENCQFPFKEGTQYLVFARINGATLDAGYCSGTEMLSASTTALAELGPGMKPGEPIPTDFSKMREEQFPDNSPKFLWPYKKGKPHGVCNSYYGNGQIACKQKFRFGVPDGKFIVYDRNGRTIKKLKYKKGKKDGVNTWFFSNGPLRQEIYFKQGWMDGDFLKYHPNGKPALVAKYKNGTPKGRFTAFYSNGNPQTIRFYKGGTIDADFDSSFHENGNIQSLTIQKKDQLLSSIYFSDGKLESFGYSSFDGNRLFREDYHPSGTLKNRGWKNPDSTYRTFLEQFREDGTRARLTQTKGDSMETFAWHRNGRIKKQSSHKMGTKKSKRKKGFSKIYAQDGALREHTIETDSNKVTVTYKNEVIIQEETLTYGSGEKRQKVFRPDGSLEISRHFRRGKLVSEKRHDR